MEANATKTALAYSKLKELFKDNHFNKNRIIPTNEIAETICMGRAPVMEALKRLESERYIKIIPQKGIMVREMTIQEMRDINDMRIALEGFMVRKLAPNFNEDDIVQVVAMIDEQKKADQVNDPRRFIKSDEMFHLYLCERCGNYLLINEMQRLRERFFTVGFSLVMKPGRMTSTVIEHEAIIEALKKHDAMAAMEAMEFHLESGKRHMI